MANGCNPSTSGFVGMTTAANIKDDKVFKETLEQSISNTKTKPSTAVANTGYSYEDNFKYLHGKHHQELHYQ